MTVKLADLVALLTERQPEDDAASVRAGGAE